MGKEVSGEDRELDRAIVEVLVRRLEENPSTITYGDLARELKDRLGRDDVKVWRFFDRPLGRIQDACVELALPSLPVMAVRKNDMRPGGGFASYYRLSHPESAGMSDEEIGRSQWDGEPRAADMPRQGKSSQRALA